MIALTRLGQSETFYLNPDLIERIDAHVDTVVRLTNGIEYVVTERPEVIVERIVDFRRRASMAGPVITRYSPSDEPEPTDATGATVLELPSNREVDR